MKVLGIILTIVGVIMLAINTINFTTEEKVVDLGPLEVNKEKEHTIGWPMYVGGLIAAGGIVLIAVGSKKK